MSEDSYGSDYVFDMLIEESDSQLCKCGHPKSDHEPGYACSGVLPVPYGEDLVEWCQCTVFTPKQSNDGQEER